MDEKIREIGRGERVDGMDLMDRLVRSSYWSELGSYQQNKGLNKGGLSRDDIRGNAFVMLDAGHETSAGVIHFILLELAYNPESQRRLQRDVDEICGDRDPSSWDYESVISPRMASMLGACMSETLRVTPAIVEIPKKVPSKQGEVITIDSKNYLVPSKTVISLVAVSVHRNSRYWPGRPSLIHDGKDDINDWVPERWYRKSRGSTARATESKGASSEDEEFGGYEVLIQAHNCLRQKKARSFILAMDRDHASADGLLR
ncbi:cytochrome p450 [Fusarium beomiforme]|uniref:Cytochrome p450 n=1 Tax=Fusarium beomiforme TaxID=44412 RepID=A0A9P5DT87_9HYPO|nr:cytochrome p450 [Fusarium beomiforme]